MDSLKDDNSPSLRMLSARGLSAGYGEKTAFENLYLDLIENQSTVFLGPGSSGKSTLLKLIAKEKGIWSQGNLFVPWSSWSYCSQEDNLPAEQKLDTLIRALNPRVRNTLRQLKLYWAGCPQLLSKLENILYTPLGELSDHEQRLVRLTLVLMQNRSLVLLDEPEVGCSTEELSELIFCLNQFRRHKTIITATHHLRLARELADFVVLMAYGRIIESKPVEIFFTAPSHPYTQSVIRMGC